jgi:hypothetical protein
MVKLLIEEVVAPVLHKYVTGAVANKTVTEAAPVESPLHETSVVFTAAVNVLHGGWLIRTLFNETHPF